MGMLLLLNVLTTGKTQSGFFFFTQNWGVDDENTHKICTEQLFPAWVFLQTATLAAGKRSKAETPHWNPASLRELLIKTHTHTLPVSLKHRMLQCSQQNISLCVCSPMMRTVIWETFLALASPSLLQCGPFFVCLRMTEGDSWIKIEV